MNNDEENKGDGAPPNAPKTEQENEIEDTDDASQSCQENTLEEQVDQPEGASECSPAEPNTEEHGSDDNPEEHGSDDDDNEEHGSESGADDKHEGASQSSQKSPSKVDSNNPKETSESKAQGDETNKNPDDKPLSYKRFSGAGRKRYRHFLTLGLSEEEARKKALIPFGQTTLKGPGSSRKNPRRPPLDRPMQVCVIHSDFPEELLTTEQIKALQEAITDKILEISVQDTKPKFTNSIVSKGWLTLTCANLQTAQWIREVAPTLTPWEDASLKAKYQHDMPHPEIYVAFFPESHDYSEDKIFKLLSAQNDRFHVPKWKIIKKVPVGTEAEVTISIDRKFSGLLKKSDYKVNYKFGQVQLWPKKEESQGNKPKVEPGGSTKGVQQQRGKGPPKRRGNASARRGSRRPPPPRNNYGRSDRDRHRWSRGTSPRSRSRDSYEQSRRNFQGSRRAEYRGSPPRSPWNYSSEPSSPKRSRDEEDYRDSQRFKAPRTSWEDSRSSQVWENDDLRQDSSSYNSHNLGTWVAEPWKPWKKYN